MGGSKTADACTRKWYKHTTPKPQRGKPTAQPSSTDHTTAAVPTGAEVRAEIQQRGLGGKHTLKRKQQLRALAEAEMKGGVLHGDDVFALGRDASGKGNGTEAGGGITSRFSLSPDGGDDEEAWEDIASEDISDSSDDSANKGRAGGHRRRKSSVGVGLGKGVLLSDSSSSESVEVCLVMTHVGYCNSSCTQVLLPLSLTDVAWPSRHPAALTALSGAA